MWHHVNAHECHREPILDLMSLLPKDGSFVSEVIKPRELEQHRSKFLDQWPNAVALNTKAPELMFPTPALDFIDNNSKEKYIVVQPEAGRKDNSRRYMTPEVIDQAKEHAEKVILLGAEYDYPEDDKVTNLTGKTSIEEVLKIVKGSSGFLGYHGFIAYVSMSMQKPSKVLLDNPHLFNHYINPHWLSTTKIGHVPCQDNCPTKLRELGHIQWIN